MKTKAFILPILLTTMLVLSGCKDGKQAPAGEPATEPESATATESAAEPEAAEPAYDLAAIGRAIADCDVLENFEDGVAAFRRDGEWLYVDKLGRLVDKPAAEEEEAILVERNYEAAGSFHEGLCWVYSEEGDNCGIGYINEKGELVIPCQYEWAVDHIPHDFHEGLCPVMTIPERELYSYIDKTGAIAFPGYYSTGSNFSEGLAGVREFVLDGDNVVEIRNGYIDKTGKNVIRLDENCSGGEFHDGVAKVFAFMDQKAWMIDKEGNKLFDLDPDKYYLSDDMFFSEGLCAFGTRDGQKGFMDKTGRTTLQAAEQD